MPEKLSSHFVELVQDALLKSYWRRKAFRNVLRRNGVAVVRSEGMVWVSAPVFDETGAVRSTMSTVVPAGRLNLPALTRVVTGAARAVSNELRRRAAAVG